MGIHQDLQHYICVPAANKWPSRSEKLVLPYRNGHQNNMQPGGREVPRPVASTVIQSRASASDWSPLRHFR